MAKNKSGETQVSEQKKWKPTRQYYNDKYGEQLKKGGLTPVQAAYRSGYLKAAQHDAEAFKYGAARYKGMNKAKAKLVSKMKMQDVPEIKGVKMKRTYVDEE